MTAMSTQPAPNPRRIVRKPLDTLPEPAPGETRELDPLGRVVTLDETEAVITAGDSGAPSLVNRAKRFQVEYAGDLRPAQPQNDMDALSALQVGLSRILLGMKCHSFNLEALLEDNNDLQSRDWELARVIYDFPRAENDIDPMPSACIAAPGDQSYERQSLGTVLLEDSIDVFGAGTVLRKLSSFNCTMEITTWCATKEERRGLKAALERTLLAEPGSDLQGRRIVVREAFDRVARFVLESASYLDDPGLAQAKTWIMKCRVVADIDRVMLVVRPGYMEVPSIGVEI